MAWIWRTLVVAAGGALVAWMGVWWWRARRERRCLTERHPVDWNAIASSEFSGESERLAVNIVVETIAHCLDIPQGQVYPDDDIILDYTYPTFWDVITIDNPCEEIMETIRERIERDYPPWDEECGPQVRDIIAKVARHLESCRKSSGGNKEMEDVDQASPCP